VADIVEVLDFWLREIGPDGWYAGGDAIDAACRGRFGDLWAMAHEGGLDHWIDGPTGTLAYLIVTDQFPRNIHRGTALAFATDARARSAARKAVDAGWDMLTPEPERQFFYMPFEHSEDAGDQVQAVRYLSERLPSHPDLALHARAHQEIIRRYGRFPTRNEALGRLSSVEEQAYLDKGGYGALVTALKSQASAAPI
jgi:uncharacterized protein (DUF924 family)